ncbi:MAG TPA: protein-methionine-sulfoxide reductase heme-binding subunit MsrQ [Gammaproteobacteria bacterium]|nr:protein-methionine-sulfoxide reductase heme-binding subunit MsrQ [Gammaproteobacteria bacterium]
MKRLLRVVERTRLVKPLVFALCLLPLASLIAGAAMDELGANPAETLIRANGDWALRFLYACLALTPLRVATGIAAFARYRRMLGLFAFTYAVLHLLCYAVFDQGLVVADIARDIAKRPFILVGFAAFLALLPLAATSTTRALRALGPRRWQALHRLVYPIALLGLLHLFWMRSGKHHYEDVWIYAAVLALLLGWRLRRSLRRARLRAVAEAA